MQISRHKTWLQAFALRLCTCLFLTLGVGALLAAQENKPASPPVATPKGATEPRSPADQKLAEEKRLANEEAALKRKAELLAFAEKHAPQLRALLEMLETKRPRQFRQALVSLSRDAERLTALQARDPERFELDLSQWKNNQRIQILTAKLTLQGTSPEARNELKKLVTRRTEIRQQLLQLELKRARDRVTRLEEQATKLATPTESELEQQVEQILTRAQKSGGSQPAPSPADANRSAKGDQ
jgi:hypothetical protein